MKKFFIISYTIIFVLAIMLSIQTTKGEENFCKSQLAEDLSMYLNDRCVNTGNYINNFILSLVFIFPFYALASVLVLEIKEKLTKTKHLNSLL